MYLVCTFPEYPELNSLLSRITMPEKEASSLNMPAMRPKVAQTPMLMYVKHNTAMRTCSQHIHHCAVHASWPCWDDSVLVVLADPRLLGLDYTWEDMAYEAYLICLLWKHSRDLHLESLIAIFHNLAREACDKLLERRYCKAREHWSGQWFYLSYDDNCSTCGNEQRVVLCRNRLLGLLLLGSDFTCSRRLHHWHHCLPCGCMLFKSWYVDLLAIIIGYKSPTECWRPHRINMTCGFLKRQTKYCLPTLRWLQLQQTYAAAGWTFVVSVFSDSSAITSGCSAVWVLTDGRIESPLGCMMLQLCLRNKLPPRCTRLSSVVRNLAGLASSHPYN